MPPSTLQFDFLALLYTIYYSNKNIPYKFKKSKYIIIAKSIYPLQANRIQVKNLRPKQQLLEPLLLQQTRTRKVGN